MVCFFSSSADWNHNHAGIKAVPYFTDALVQNCLIVLNPCKFQHTVNYGKHPLSADLDILNISLQLFPFIQMLSCQIRITDDGIHRRPDIMGHIEQKCGFCLIG